MSYPVYDGSYDGIFQKAPELVVLIAVDYGYIGNE